MSRLRDPLIAKFISADPTIPNLYDLQSFNRYAYVRNNPLKFYDPSGYNSMELHGGGAGSIEGLPDESIAGGSKVSTAAETPEKLKSKNDINARTTTSISLGLVAIKNAIQDVKDGYAGATGSVLNSEGENRYELTGRYARYGVNLAIGMLPGSSLPAVGEAFGGGEIGTGLLLLGSELLGPLGKLGKVGKVGRETTILGENMSQRVIPYAEKTGARTIPFGTEPDKWAKLTPKEKYHMNDGALRARINEGDSFKYIGQDNRTTLQREKFDLTRSELLRLNDRGIPYETVSPSIVRSVLGRY